MMNGCWYIEFVQQWIDLARYTGVQASKKEEEIVVTSYEVLEDATNNIDEVEANQQ